MDATSVLRITYDVHAAMVDHCLRESPNEACGVLGGVAPRADRFFPMRNVARNPTVRYDADPADLIAMEMALREDRHEILAIYHSHPRWKAEPSRSDLALNFRGNTPRIIVSLLDERSPEVRVWRLFAWGFQELPWRLVPVASGCMGE